MDVAAVALIGQALAVETRVQLLSLLDGRTRLSEAAAMLNVTSATASYHLRLLARAGLVEVSRDRQHLPRRVPDALRVLARAFD